MRENPFTLEGRTILVTGASSGIGRQTCVAISRMGGLVIATGRSAERLRETESLLEGAGHRSFAADLTAPADRSELVARLPGLNGVVHSAGIARLLPLPHVTERLLRETHAINFDAPVLLTRELLRAKRYLPGASIVFVSSLSGMTATFGHLPYASSKAALIAATRVVALELAPVKTRCNCLCPGMVRTPMLAAAPITEAQQEQLESRYPLGPGRPEDVANAAVFLLSEASRWITGTTLVLDGGRLCQ